jgi:hypothetical protein
MYYIAGSVNLHPTSQHWTCLLLLLLLRLPQGLDVSA